jgi:hypothetical protein
MGWKSTLVGLVVALIATPAIAATFDIHELLASKFEELSLPIPTPAGLVVCHGFGCRYHTEIGLSQADQAKLIQILTQGRASATAERKSLARAVAWFARRIGPEAGTSRAIARSNRQFPTGDPSQFDCIDTSTNTTALFLVLDRMGLLRHHRLALPVSRHLFIDGGPHTTAVLTEAKTGQKWAIDPWTHNSGELPDVLPLVTWMEQR